MNGFDWNSLFNADELLLTSAFSPLQILLSLLLTLLIGLFIYFVYRKTYSGVLYSKNFNLTLVMTALIVDAIMMGISGNIILSLGLVGALSIVRFRTAVKDPKDTAFLFWAITVGVINGVAYYELAVIASIFIAGVLFFSTRIADYERSYVMILSYKGDLFPKISSVVEKRFGKFTVRSDSRDGTVTEKVIEVKNHNDEADTDKALAKIRKIQGVEKCVFLASNGDFAE